MALDGFIKIDGIPGESTDAGHQEWIEVLSYEHTLEQPASATASSVGGGTAERVNHKPFVFRHLYDKASPKLFDAACTGRHIKTITFELWRAAGDEKVKYLEITMEQSIISKIVSRGADAVGGFPSEEVSISYGKIKVNYTQQKRDGGQGGGNVAAGWDCTENKTYA
ncbi:MAG: type VI secretion system tube protein Hcp [Betaproteobacteria bacterium]|nr:type VI secretion system tube protein Hcp [Betaproteobacteria bacterium]